MSDTRFGVIVVTVAFAAILLAVLLMSAAEWLQALSIRKQLYTGRHAAPPVSQREIDQVREALEAVERGEIEDLNDFVKPKRARWWPWSTRDDDWDGLTDDDGQDIADIFEDDDPSRVPGNPEFDREMWGETYGQPGEPGDPEDVPRLRPETGTGGRAEPERATAPGYHHHDDAPTEVVPAVRLSDGSYAGLSGTIPANLPRPGMEAQGEPAIGPHPDGLRANTGPGQPHRWPTPYPHAGPPAWHPARPPLQPWIQAILGAPTVEAWAWGWQQQRRLAITI
jgi:hypothetical protein